MIVNFRTNPGSNWLDLQSKSRLQVHIVYEVSLIYTIVSHFNDFQLMAKRFVHQASCVSFAVAQYSN